MVSERAEESFPKTERGRGSCKFTYQFFCICFAVAIVCSCNFVFKFMLLVFLFCFVVLLLFGLVWFVCVCWMSCAGLYVELLQRGGAWANMGYLKGAAASNVRVRTGRQCLKNSECPSINTQWCDRLGVLVGNGPERFGWVKNWIIVYVQSLRVFF